jgi:hypothetical protein
MGHANNPEKAAAWSNLRSMARDKVGAGRKRVRVTRVRQVGKQRSVSSTRKKLSGFVRMQSQSVRIPLIINPSRPKVSV